VAGDASVIDRVDKIEARLGLGTSVHVGLCKHEVEVGSDCVGEGEGRKSANVWLGTAQLWGVCWGGDDGVTVKGGVGTDVGVQNVVGAGSDYPCGVEVATESCEGDGGANYEHVVTEKIDREGEVFGGL
jgi:hypothetical protein